MSTAKCFLNTMCAATAISAESSKLVAICNGLKVSI
jgi:hypothetical protein